MMGSFKGSSGLTLELIQGRFSMVYPYKDLEPMQGQPSQKPLGTIRAD